MTRNKRKETFLKELAVAKLLSQEKGVKQIAYELGISSQRVSQLAADNKHLNYYKPKFKPKFDNKKQKKEMLYELDEMLGSGKYREALNKETSPKNEIKVEVAYDIKREKIGRAIFSNQTVRAVSKSLERASMVGVCGGPSIKPMVETSDGFEKRISSKGHKPIHFIPLLGLTHLESEASRFSSTMVSLRYHQAINFGFTDEDIVPFNLNCIPHYIDCHGSPPDSSGCLLEGDVRKFINHYFPGYKKIFGANSHRHQEGALINKVDTILTGIGSSEEKKYNFLDPEAKGYVRIYRGRKYMKIPITEIRENIICGDIAGVFLPKHADDKDCISIVDALNSRLATLNAEHLSHCVKETCKAKNNETEIAKSDGVICIAFGGHKKRALLQAIASGYINKVIIDSEMADALMEE